MIRSKFAHTTLHIRILHTCNCIDKNMHMYTHAYACIYVFIGHPITISGEQMSGDPINVCMYRNIFPQFVDL